LEQARTLYAEAAYEEALATLPASSPSGREDEADEYRTLCLLALGKIAEAERTTEGALMRNFAFSMADASPRGRDFVGAIRQRVLPIRAESLYARGRADLEDRNYTEALNKFSTLLALLDEPEVAKLSDLRAPTEQFRATAERLAAAERAKGTTSPDEANRIYTRLAAAVKPPVQVSRKLPLWTPPRDQAWRTFRGVVEVVVDREGRVESAKVIESLAAFYDGPLADAAMTWHFEPARLNGQPVRFRHQIEIVMRPKTN
jgi:tetratricopeptide (TPR) repeat protein